MILPEIRVYYTFAIHDFTKNSRFITILLFVTIINSRKNCEFRLCDNHDFEDYFVVFCISVAENGQNTRRKAQTNTEASDTEASDGHSNSYFLHPSEASVPFSASTLRATYVSTFDLAGYSPMLLYFLFQGLMLECLASRLAVC